MTSSKRFKKPIFICNTLCLAVGVLWIFFLSSSNLPANRSSTAALGITTNSREQTRQHVRKDLWIAQNAKERLHDRIESDSSLLILNPKNKSIEVIEKLEGVRGWIEEKAEDTKQGSSVLHLRHFAAKEGVYFYKDQTFKAFNVALSLYKIQGKNRFTWQPEYLIPFLQGTAEKLNFSLKGGVPMFQATHFSASLTGDSAL